MNSFNFIHPFNCGHDMYTNVRRNRPALISIYGYGISSAVLFHRKGSVTFDADRD